MSFLSPCNSVCKMDKKSELCTGCWRTIDEIATWSSHSDEAKKKIWTLIKLRKKEAGNLSSDASSADKAP